MAASHTIDPKEAAHFGALAADWWDPKGSSAMLHKLNPVRLGYIRARIDAHWDLDPADLKPLAGKRVADVGCGAGLLAEPLARLGGRVTGIDAAPENIAAARAHAEGQGLEIDYRVGDVAALDGPFDLITSMEVVEHVADVPAFIAGLAERAGGGRPADPLDAEPHRAVEADDDPRRARASARSRAAPTIGINS